MNLSEQLDDEFNQEDLDTATQSAFLEAAKWSKWIVVFGGGVILLVAVLFLILLLVGGRINGDAIISILVLIFVGIPFYYLYQFSTKTKEAIETSDDVLFTVGLQNLKSFFKFWGVLTILLLAYYLIAIIFIFSFASASF